MITIELHRRNCDEGSWLFPDDGTGPERLNVCQMMERVISEHERRPITCIDLRKIGFDFVPDGGWTEENRIANAIPGTLRVYYEFRK